MTDQEFDVVVRLTDKHLADELEDWLHEAGAGEVQVVRDHGIVDPVTLMFVLVLVIGRIAGLGFWLRDKTRCRTIYDCRHPTVQISQDCSARDGRMLVIDANGEHTLYEPEKPSDLSQILFKLLSPSN